MNCYYYYYYYIWIYLNISDGKASFLQSSVSHDPSEIILIGLFNAQETFLIIINVENSCSCAAYDLWISDFKFLHLFAYWFIRQFKRTVFIWDRNLL